MSAHEKGYILISNDVEVELERVASQLHPHRVVSFFREKFLVEDAKAVIAEAYISESAVKYIVMGSYDYNTVSQNALLKVLEEPPRNIEFIIISANKSNLLPTVRSRLGLHKGKKLIKSYDVDINLAKLDYAEIFSFLKKHARISKSEAKELIQALYHRATVVDMLILNTQQLQNFENAYRLLELNSRPQSVLSLILMSFISYK